MMGAQQVKSYDERLIQHMGGQLPNLSMRRISQQKATVMHNQSISSESSSRQCITVADFARIKMEPLSTFNSSADAVTLCEKIKIQDQVFPDRPAAVIPDRCEAIDFISLAAVEPKEELLSMHAEGNGKIVTPNDASLLLSWESNAVSSCKVQSEIGERNHHITNIMFERKENESNNLLLETEKDASAVDTNFKLNGTKLVRNPLAFLKKNCDRNQNQEECLNVTIKSDYAVNASEMLGNTSKIKAEFESITLNELIIKSEDFFMAETNDEETLANADLYQTCLCHNLNSSLDVNLSSEGSGVNEFPSKQLSDDVISNISLNTSPQSVKYLSTFEIYSGEDNAEHSQKTQLNKIFKPRRKPKAYQKNNKKYKVCEKQNYQNKPAKNRPQVKLLVGPKKDKNLSQKKYSKKDSPFKPGLAKRDIMKKLPKTTMQTRKNTKKMAARRMGHSSSKAEFPKPFKLETITSQKNQNVTLELPKPVMFKSEFAANSRNKQSHLKPELQPLVRLKRLKSEELLVPLKRKYAGRKRAFKATSETGRNFLIRRAYSLHPSSEYSRLSLSVDQDRSGHNEQRRYASSCSVLTDLQTEPGDETESKYFNTHGGYSSFFPPSTPDDCSVFSAPIDNGASTSTPSVSQQPGLGTCHNKSLLLEIAAERAFINNHLMHFGYSPVQFDLYNNLNELTVFLKFLFGNTRMQTNL